MNMKLLMQHSRLEMCAWSPTYHVEKTTGHPSLIVSLAYAELIKSPKTLEEILLLIWFGSILQYSTDLKYQELMIYFFPIEQTWFGYHSKFILSHMIVILKKKNRHKQH